MLVTTIRFMSEMGTVKGSCTPEGVAITTHKNRANNRPRKQQKRTNECYVQAEGYWCSLKRE